MALPSIWRRGAESTGNADRTAGQTERAATERRAQDTSRAMRGRRSIGGPTVTHTRDGSLQARAMGTNRNSPRS